MLIYIAIGVAGFVAGVLVGRNNAKAVEKIVTDLKAKIDALEAKIK